MLDENDELEPPLKRRNRLSSSSIIFACFICEKGDEDEKLHRVETFSCNDRIKSMAQELEDHKLLGKLSQGDLIAIEGRYHKSCMTDLTNRHRSCFSAKNNVQNEQALIEDM